MCQRNGNQAIKIKKGYYLAFNNNFLGFEILLDWDPCFMSQNIQSVHKKALLCTILEWSWAAFYFIFCSCFYLTSF